MEDDRPSVQLGDAQKRVRKAFSQIDRRPTLSEEVLRRLIEVLHEGHISPGDKLPPERELATMLGISRPAVREALRALSLLGIIDARPGRGTRVVESLDALPLEPVLVKLLLNRARLLDLMEMRKIFEPEVAALAAERASESARAAIQARFREHERLVQETDDVEADADAGQRFHLELARATGNSALSQLLFSLSDLIKEMGKLIVSRKHGVSLEWHRAVMEAVLARDPAEAKRVMRDHLDEVEKELRESLEAMDAEAERVS
jgi:GntR family transcriptional repressor for pyruvate dehydrogenase complex